jgi:hypothetical protein
MQSSHQSPVSSQSNIPSGSRVHTPAGIGTLEGIADVFKRGTTEVESVCALVSINGRRQAFDVSEIRAAS